MDMDRRVSDLKELTINPPMAAGEGGIGFFQFFSGMLEELFCKPILLL